tara:strand:- start:332 stop:655 length:324 start_codon:yes stop_codon:yes gene_type:complete
MESEFVAQLLDLGITGIFIGYLLWKDKAQTKALAEFVDRLMKTMSEIDAKREEGYEQVRDRYDVIIERYNSERDRLLTDISKKLDEGLGAMRERTQEEKLRRLSREK